MPETKIYLYCVPGGIRPTDVMGYALAEDGHCIASHLSSNETWSKHDMGLTSDWKHDHYAKEYPDGYELEWVPMQDVETHVGLNAALCLNRALAEMEDEDA